MPVPLALIGRHWPIIPFLIGIKTLSLASLSIGAFTLCPHSKTPPTREFIDDWLLRTVEIVDKYEPELIWFDWWMASEHFWQTDTSVSKSSWGYVENHKYKEASSLVDDLIDIVSKNGSMLLNIGPKTDATIPQKEIDMLAEIGEWLSLNGEAIYDTRPWVTFGEGLTVIIDGKHSNDGEKHRQDFNKSDIRFTTSDNTLYAIMMAWPGDNETITIRSINKENYPDQIADIELIGYDGDIVFEQTTNGLIVTLPTGSPSKYAQVLKITQ